MDQHAAHHWSNTLGFIVLGRPTKSDGPRLLMSAKPKRGLTKGG